jgi:hypothetical protein
MAPRPLVGFGDRGGTSPRRWAVTDLSSSTFHAGRDIIRPYVAAIDLDNFAILDEGTGLYMGVMNNGQLLVGDGGPAGEIGHVTTDGAAEGPGHWSTSSLAIGVIV